MENACEGKGEIGRARGRKDEEGRNERVEKKVKDKRKVA